jgi:glutamate/tyrosine decarboxylase-like PLP-dependent enzyme
MTFAVKPAPAKDVRLPPTGLNREAVERHLDALRAQDKDRRLENWNARCFLYTFHANDQIYEVGASAYQKYLKTDPLGRSVFPSLGPLQDDLIGYARNLLNGDDQTGGTLTTGGTESAILAMFCARRWAKERRFSVKSPNIICSRPTHPSFYKAAELLGLQVIRIAETAAYTADVEAFRAAITDQTIMLVGNAPTLWHGVIDPIEDLGRVAIEHDLWLHVDACMGGFFAPFVRKLGHNMPPFDLAVPGVRSLAADLHKYAYTPIGAALLMLKDVEEMRHHIFEWQDVYCRYSTHGLIGTHTGGAIAAAWAVMNFVGERGYLELTGAVLKARQTILDGVRAIDGLTVRGDPQLSIIAFGGIDVDTAAVYSGLKRRRWSPNMFDGPQSIHVRLTPAHAATAEEFVEDLQASVDDVRRGVQQAEHRSGFYTG